MPTEVVESTSAPASTESPSYSPPANEPQGLESASPKEETSKTPDPVSKDTETPATSTMKLPSSIKAPAKTGRFQERISDLVNQRDLSKRETETLREENARLKEQWKIPADKAASAKEAGTGINPEDFPTYGEYISALVKDTIEQKTKSEQSQRAKESYEAHKQERMQSFNTHASPLVQQYGEGFWDTITDPQLPITEAMADAVMELEQLGPMTMLYLAAHKDESARISKLNPRAATIAIGRLAAQLDQEMKQDGGVETPVQAQEIASMNPMGVARPTPVPTPRGSAPSLNPFPNDKDSVDEWLQKETDRLRRINPNAKFYGAR